MTTTTLERTPENTLDGRRPTVRVSRIAAPDAAMSALLAAVTLTGLSAGFFVTYLISVTRGLAITGDVAYVESFQAINETIRSVPFAAIFFGPVPAIALAIGTGFRSGSNLRRGLVTLALPLYLTTVAITFGANVPLNEQLASAASSDPTEAALARDAFEDEWNRFNTLRTFTAVGSFVALAAASVSGSGRTAGRSGDAS